MAYPRSAEDKCAFWLSQIEYARKKIKPLFEASKVLEQQFFNDPSSERESFLEDSPQGPDAHLRRVKSGLVFGWIDQSCANMLDRRPVFQLFPETKESAQRLDPQDPNSPTLASGAAKIVNYRYRETNQLRVDERVMLDAFLYPYGVAKIGYTVDVDKRIQSYEMLQQGSEYEFDDPEDENLFLAVGTPCMVTEFQDHRFHIQSHFSFQQGGLLNFRGQDPQLAEETLARHIEIHRVFMKRPKPDANTNVKFESPFATRWLPDMFLTDALSLEGPQDARWVAFGWELPIDEVQANPNYSNTGDLQPHRWRDAPDKDQDKNWCDGLDLVYGWEIWAKNFPVGRGDFRDILITIVETGKKPLQDQDEWPYENLDDYPAETLVFQPGHRSWFRKSPLLMGGADSTQGLVNEILDSYLNVVRKTKNIWLADPETGFTTAVLQDILDAPDCSVVEVPGLSEAQGRSVVPLQFFSTPPDKGELLAIVQQLFDRSMGTPQPISMPATDTATEVSIIEKRNTSRENRRSALLSEFQLRKARKMWQLDTQYRPDRLFLLDRNAWTFVSLTREMAQGEFLFTMDVTSHATALSIERSQWMDLLNLFAGLTPVMMQTAGMPPNLPELARRLLVRGFSEQMVEEILPMLQPQMGPPPGGGPSEIGGGTGSGTEFANPEAQLAQEGVEQGKNVGAGIGPLDRDSFNRALPQQGALEGAAERV